MHSHFIECKLEKYLRSIAGIVEIFVTIGDTRKYDDLFSPKMFIYIKRAYDLEILLLYKSYAHSHILMFSSEYQRNPFASMR